MACLSHHWQHREVNMTQAIQMSHSPHWLHSCLQAGMFFEAKEAVHRLSDLP